MHGRLVRPGCAFFTRLHLCSVPSSPHPLFSPPLQLHQGPSPSVLSCISLRADFRGAAAALFVPKCCCFWLALEAACGPSPSTSVSQEASAELLCKDKVPPDCIATPITHPVHLQSIGAPRLSPPGTVVQTETVARYLAYSPAATRLHRRAFHPGPIVDPGNLAATILLAATPSPASINHLSLPATPSLLLHNLRDRRDCRATRCPTTLAGSRSRCRRSASTSLEHRDPRAHRLRQATPSTSRRSRNARIPAPSHRCHHHHAPRHCASMSSGQRVRAVWQTPRHRRPAANLGQQRLTPKASMMKSLSVSSSSSRRQATDPTY